MMVSLQDFDISSLRLVGARSSSRYDLFKLSDHLQHDLWIMKIPEPSCGEGLYSTPSIYHIISSYGAVSFNFSSEGSKQTGPNSEGLPDSEIAGFIMV